MQRISLDIPVTDMAGRWTPQAAAALVGTQWPLKMGGVKLGETELGDMAIPARVIAAEASADGLTMRVELEIDIPLTEEFAVHDISVDGD